MATAITTRVRNYLRTAPRPIWLVKLGCLSLYRASLSFEIDAPKVGFFAHLNWCLLAAAFCERHGLIPQLSCVSPQYRDPIRSRNWLTHFFEVPSPAKADFIFSDLRQLQLASLSGLSSIEAAARLTAKYLPVKAEIARKVESFLGTKMAGCNVLGIHFRGTDKTEEAERVDWEFLKQTVERFLEHNPSINCLFVASDEEPFIRFMERSFPGIPVISHDDAFRSGTNRACYLDDHGPGNYDKAEEALINCLLLSRCSALIRSTSFLSAWASIFNPAVPVVLLNRPYEKCLWFPENILINKSLHGYLPDLPSLVR